MGAVVETGSAGPYTGLQNFSWANAWGQSNDANGYTAGLIIIDRLITPEEKTMLWNWRNWMMNPVGSYF